MVLSIILTILKILGFILLGILALILLLLLLVLFVPFCYGAKGYKKDDDINIRFRFSWLFNAIRVNGVYDGDDPVIKAWFLFIKVFDSRKVKEKPEKPKEEKPKEEEPEEKKTSIVDKLKANKDLLLSEDTKELIADTLYKVKRMIRHILPRKVKGELDYSMGEPDLTGYILAIYGMLYPGVYKHLTVRPDFEREQFFDGKGELKGHFFVIVFVVLALRIALDKRMIRIIKCLTREEI